MKHKKLIVAGIAIFSIIVFLSIFAILWFWGDSYPDFSDSEFHRIELPSGDNLEIAGLKDGAVPQGICNYTYTDKETEFLTKQEYLFISAYMKKGPSRLYVLGTRTGYVGYVTLKNEDGSDYTGHAGGVATNCNQTKNGSKARVQYGTLWVVSDGTVFCAQSSNRDKYYNIAEEVIVKAALSLTEEEQSIKFTSSFNANNGASFCFFYEDGTDSDTNDKLYVGEFYRDGDDRYTTAESHHITTHSGGKQYAFVNEYTSNISATAEDNNRYGVACITGNTYALDENGDKVAKKFPRIERIISIPDKIQGFALTADNKLILSESYGLPNSHLYYYDWEAITKSSTSNQNRALFTTLTGGSNFEYEGVYRETKVKYSNPNMYVYVANADNLVRDYSIPSMAEGMCVNGDRVYVLFESGCYKYKLFVRQRITDIVFFTPREKN